MTNRDYVILLIEDDPNDVFFLEEAFRKAGRAESLRVVRDGEEAIQYLSRGGAYVDAARSPTPSLILLDLKLPRKSGFEVLAWQRAQPELKRVPVVVLTASQSSADIARAYDLGANAYLVKPLGSEAQLKMVKTLCTFWLGLNKAPEAR